MALGMSHWSWRMASTVALISSSWRLIDSIASAIRTRTPNISSASFARMIMGSDADRLLDRGSARRFQVEMAGVVAADAFGDRARARPVLDSGVPAPDTALAVPIMSSIVLLGHS